MRDDESGRRGEPCAQKRGLHDRWPGSRRLGSRLASFVALLEVVAGVVFAWLLLAQLPRAVQLVGGLFVLAGVVLVKLGEPSVESTDERSGLVLSETGHQLP